MTSASVRSRVLAQDRVLHVSDEGAFFVSDANFVQRMGEGEPTLADVEMRSRLGHQYEGDDPFSRTVRLYNLAQRWEQPGDLDYLILVPTLRCNLSCSYCQVSRVSERTQGYDWSEETLDCVLAMLDGLPTRHIKIEFQGGEPTLRPDIIRRVLARCERFERSEFVICTNLQNMSDEIWSILEDERVYVSTSLDGTREVHERQRTGKSTGEFWSNLTAVIERFGSKKVSALPTIDPKNPPPIDEILDTYRSLDLDSIFLRPINYQGFARKRHSHSRLLDAGWSKYHRDFVERLIERNWSDRTRVVEETYFSICLRRIFQPTADRHVDLRNPNPLAADYLVIDHDGTIYPTDEARMLARSGVVDLSLGTIGAEIDQEKLRLLNAHASNTFDAACERCAYQAFCGKDVVDDLARYGTIDVERTATAFCRKHLAIFDHIFELIHRDCERVNYSLARWLRLDGTGLSLGERLQ